MLLAAVLVLVSSVSCVSSQCQRLDADVLILGAGMAGLGAAEIFSQNGIDNFLIIEQSGVVGGKVQSAKFGGGVVELGAQWLFDADFNPPEGTIGNPLIPIIERCGIQFRSLPLGAQGIKGYNSFGEDITTQLLAATARYNAAVSPDIVGSVLSLLPDEEDIPASQGLRVGGWNARSLVEELAELFLFDIAFGVPPDLGSYRDTFDPVRLAVRSEVYGPASPAGGFIITHPEGYAAMPKCFAREFLSEDDPRLLLNTVVEEVIYGDDCVCVLTSGGVQYCGRYAIITFSVTSLQSGVVKFTPELPLSRNLTLSQFEVAQFLKIYLEYDEVFWDTDTDLILYLDERRDREHYPAFAPWGSFFPEQLPILESLLIGNEAKRIAQQDLSITKQEITDIMRNIYGRKARDPVNIIMHDFIVNPYFYGDFAAVSIHIAQLVDEISMPSGNLYFAGEPYEFLIHSAVHAALIHGRETAERIVQLLQGPLRSK